MGPDQEGLTKSKIEAREFWMVHANDKTKDKTPSRRIYLNYDKAKQHCIEVAFKEPDKKIYLTKCIEVYKFDSNAGALIGEVIEDVR